MLRLRLEIDPTNVDRETGRQRDRKTERQEGFDEAGDPHNAMRER